MGAAVLSMAAPPFATDATRPMLAFFRRFISSGVAVALLGIILVAFVVTGVGTPGGGIGRATNPDEVATVGGRPVTIADLQQRAQSELRRAAQQQPGITMPALLAAVGGVGALADQAITAQVLAAWAEKHGLTASKRLVDGEIGSIPAFLGPDGKPDRNQINAVLSQQRMSYPELRQGIRDDLLTRQLLVPIGVGTRAPAGLINPYAALLLDKREGAIGLVPAKLDAAPAVSDAQVAAWYQGHLALYTLPERRVVRYAPIGPESVTVAPPTDAEIAAAYHADAVKYQASETRSVSQVVLPDAAAAQAFAAKVSGGAPFAKAAADAGFAAGDIALGALTKDALAKAASPAVADAVFALKQGGTSAPTRTPLGFAVDHVDAVTSRPARSLDQARPEIAAALTKKKAADALATLVAQAQDQINDGANFNDAAAKRRLQVGTTPPVVADGTAPTVPGFKPDATLSALMKAAGQAAPEDPPTVEPLGTDGRFALLGVAQVIPAAPLPLAQVRARVAQDAAIFAAAARARATAQAILAKVQAGTPIAAAFAAAGLPVPQPVSLTQIDLSRAQGKLPPAVRTLFRLAPGKAEVAPGPGGGWYVVRLDHILPGDAKALPAIAAATRAELGQSLGEEYAEEFAAAARAEVKVRRNPEALARLERQLRSGPGAAADQ